MTKKSQPQSSTLDISAIQKLVEEAQAPLEHVARMTTLEKKRSVKLRRGAHQVLPLIAKLARKYAVQAPGTSVDDMESNIAFAQSLEPLLGAVAVLHGTVGDAHLSAQSSAWKVGTVSYGMMKQASKANVNLANELAPVTEWFRQSANAPKAKASKAAKKAKASAPVATAEAPATTPSAPTAPAQPAQPAAEPNGAAAPVTATTPAASS